MLKIIYEGVVFTLCISEKLFLQFKINCLRRFLMNKIFKFLLRNVFDFLEFKIVCMRLFSFLFLFFKGVSLVRIKLEICSIRFLTG